MRKANTPYRVGPFYLTQRADNYHIVGSHGGKRIRVSANTNDLRRAKIALHDIASKLEGAWWRDEDTDDVSWKDVAKAICARHRWHSKARGIPFELTAIDVYNAMRSTDFRCAVSGIPLSRRVAQNVGSPDPWGASIDRIENRHGYTLENFRVVCLAANIAMNRWGLDVLHRLARGIVRSAAMVADEKPAHHPHQTGDETAQVIDLSARIAR